MTQSNDVITLAQFLQTINYRISDGAEYCWACYGPNARFIDSNADDGGSASVVFDSEDQTVYEVTAIDARKNLAYRWINPAYVKKHRKECKKRGLSTSNAYDQVDFINLEVASDMLTKAGAISQGLDYDTRVSVIVDLPDELIYQLMTFAHQRDITLNQLVEEILIQAIEDAEGK